MLRREDDLDDELAIDDALFDAEDWCKSYARKSGKSVLTDTAKLKVGGYNEWRCPVTIDGAPHTLVCTYEDGISLE